MLHFSGSFLTQDLSFSGKKLTFDNDTIDLSSEAAKDSKEALKKLKEMNLPQILIVLSTRQREMLLNNLLNLRKVHKKATFFLQVTTSVNLKTFSDCIACRHFSLQHFTSYPTSHPIQAIPTDHAGIQETKMGYKLAICDGMGHHDPEGIGRIASQVLQELLNSPLSERKSYPDFLKKLNRELRAEEGTTLLKAEIDRSEKGWKIKVANYGDSALILLDLQGKIQFKTKNHSWKAGQLGIGAGFSDKLIEHAEEETFQLKEGWLIACSDGLTQPYMDATNGNFDQTRFEKMLGVSIQLHALSSTLSRAALETAKRLHNGDDTTIIVLELSHTYG